MFFVKNNGANNKYLLVILIDSSIIQVYYFSVQGVQMVHLGRTVEASVTALITSHAIIRLENVPMDALPDGPILPVINVSF